MSFKIDDPMLAQLFSAWQSHPRLSYEAQEWARRVLNREYSAAAHLWSTLETKFPDSFRETAVATQLYLLKRLDLPQTFVDQWIAELARPAFRGSPGAQALAATFAPELDSWLVAQAIQLSPEQRKLIQSLPPEIQKQIFPLYAWSVTRQGEKAAALLTSLPSRSPMKLPLAQTAAFSLIKKKEIASAARILKAHVEPSIEASRDTVALAQHYLTIARLLYQIGQLEAAESYYLKISGGIKESYLQAREELIWVRLRMGDLEKLRGDLATLNSGLFDENFSPEVHLVRAISNLKLCFYDEVKIDFERFLKVNSSWATRITAALAASRPPRPDSPESNDVFVRLAELSIQKRIEENLRLEKLAQESIQAALPAVGVQVHWDRARTHGLRNLELARKAQDTEHRRHWLIRKQALQEAVRKMQFVKIELMSQLRTAAAATGKDLLPTSAAKSLSVEPGAQSFPFDGVLWPDELFKLRSSAQDRCLAARGERR